MTVPDAKTPFVQGPFGPPPPIPVPLPPSPPWPEGYLISSNFDKIDAAFGDAWKQLDEARAKIAEAKDNLSSLRRWVYAVLLLVGVTVGVEIVLLVLVLTHR